MFTEISWSSYVTIVIVLLVIYYLFIGLRYYRTELFRIFAGRKIPADAVKEEVPEKKNIFQLTRSLSDEIQAYLDEAGRNTLHKEEVITSLQSLLAKYPSVTDSPFRKVIQNLIVTECETCCSIHFGEKELSELW
jgi:hypothetical protein